MPRNTTTCWSIVFKVIIFIRDDILNAIDSCSADINKIITSYRVKINWYDYNTFNNDIDSLPLKKWLIIESKLTLIKWEKDTPKYGMIL